MREPLGASRKSNGISISEISSGIMSFRARRIPHFILPLFFAALAMAAFAPRAQAIELPKGKDTVLATYDGGQMTAGDFVAYLAGAGRDVTLDALKGISREALERMAREAATAQVAALMAAEDKEWTRPKDLDKALDDAKSRVIISHLYKTTISDAVTSPTDEAIKAAYEKNIDKYKTHFSFSIRHIYLNTYMPYTVKEGDTLESIAKNAAKDASKSSLILFKDTKRPRGEPVGEKEGEKKVLPLQNGEILLVPMPEEDSAKIKDKIESIYKELQEGKKFEDLAKQYSESPTGAEAVTITPDPERPMLKEIVEAVKTTEIGKYSKPFHTKHGWHIIEVVSREDERVKSLDEVRPTLVRTLKREQERDKVTEYLQNLYTNSPLLKIHMDALRQTADEKAIVAEAGDVKIERAKLLATVGDTLTTASTEKQVRDALVYDAEFQKVILLQDAQKRGILDLPEVKQVVEQSRIRTMAQYYIQSQGEKATADATEEAIKEYYDKNQDTSYKQPRQLDLYVIRLSASGPKAALREEIEKARQETQKQMEAWKSSIKSLDDFKKIAEKNSELAASSSGSVGKVTESYLGGLKGTLKGIELKKVVGPVEMDGRFYLLWADSETPESITPLDEVRDQIKERLKRTNSIESAGKFQESLAEKKNIKLVF